MGRGLPQVEIESILLRARGDTSRLLAQPQRVARCVLAAKPAEQQEFKETTMMMGIDRRPGRRP